MGNKFQLSNSNWLFVLFQFTCFRLSNDCNINDKRRKGDADHVQTDTEPSRHCRNGKPGSIVVILVSDNKANQKPGNQSL